MLINNSHISHSLGISYAEAVSTFSNVCKYVSVVQRIPDNNVNLKYIRVRHFDLDEAITVLESLKPTRTRDRDLKVLREVKVKLSL